MTTQSKIPVLHHHGSPVRDALRRAATAQDNSP